jgi:iron complex outermembrane recepter protein
MKQFKKTAIKLGVAQLVLMSSNAALAQAAPAAAEMSANAVPENAEVKVVVITGQRAALQSAQAIKRNADEVVDSIVADDIGKLPDRSVTEALQRVVGVTIDHVMSAGDPDHYSVEGSSVTIRGLSYVRSELNGRDEFSANGGRSLNFEDVPPELMAGVDVYKNPSAEQIEGAIGGLVNLRTALPFDFKGMKGGISAQETYSTLMGGKPSPSFSGMFSNRWNTAFGQFGLLIDLAHSKSKTRSDGLQIGAYYPRTDVVPGKTVYLPAGLSYGTNEFNRNRNGDYLALQWKNANIQTALTYFDSRYKMQWSDQSINGQVYPYNLKVSNATYNAQGMMVSGTLSDPTDFGIGFAEPTRTESRDSSTKDLSWNLTWKPNDRWTLKSDLQFIRARSGSFSSTVATGVQMPDQSISFAGSAVPTLGFSDADKAYLANPNNYFWAYTMEHMDKSAAREVAWKGDAKFDFDDPVLRDIRVGVRLTNQHSLTQNSNPSYNWQAVTQPWQLGWDVSQMALLGDPRFSGPTNVHTYNNFFGGNVSVPSLVLPNVSLTTGYPQSYVVLHSYHDILCQEQSAAQGWSDGCATWKPATFGTDPAGTNDQNEKTQALYTQLRFGFDDLKYPIDGNIGLRYVKTNYLAHGYSTYTPPQLVIPTGAHVTGVPVPDIAAFANAQDVEHNYGNLLPTINLRMKASDQLQFRFAYSTAMARPDFSAMQAYTTYSENVTSSVNAAGTGVNVSRVSLTGGAVGNPMLKPVTSRQVDLTAEWYFSKVGSLTLSLFNKKLKDIVLDQTFDYRIKDVSGTPQDFIVTGPINGATGTARGAELAYQQYFDKLPGWLSGIGVQANFTFIDSHQSLYTPVNQTYCTGGNTADNLALNLNGCDTNGQTFGDMPLKNLSRTSYNLALMYDKGPLSARLAYNWRSKYLQAVNVSNSQGTDGLDSNPASPTFGQHNVAWGLPLWAGDYGQLDASIFYKITENLSFGLEAQNLGNAKSVNYMQQHVGGLVARSWFYTGPRYTAQMRYTF